MPAPWMLPTKRDTLPADAGNPVMRCDGCPRRVMADVLVDVSRWPTTLRGASQYLCDACVERIVRQGHIAREDIMRLAGAPDDVVTQIQAWALAHDPIRKTKPAIPRPTP